jgi:Tfp pilus assembly protein PilE
MCGGGAARREHHKREEEKRAQAAMQAIADQAERNRQAEMARMQELQTAAEQRQQAALQQIAETSRQPVQVKTGEDATTPLMRTKKKKERAGISSLRINRTPSTNVGGGSTSGTNIG